MNPLAALRKVRLAAVREVRDATGAVGRDVWRIRAHGVLVAALVAAAAIGWSPRPIVIVLAVAAFVVAAAGVVITPRLAAGPLLALLLATVIAATWTDSPATRAVGMTVGTAGVWAAQSVYALGATVPSGCRVHPAVTRTWWRWSVTTSLAALAVVAVVALVGHAAAHPTALVTVGVLAALALLATPTVRAWRSG